MMRTICFSNWNFRVFHVNGKHPGFIHGYAVQLSATYEFNLIIFTALKAQNVYCRDVP